MAPLRRIVISLVLLSGIFNSSFSIIVWNGKIVAEWPLQPPPFLRKTIAAPTTSASVSEGFGLYSHPSGKIFGLTMIVDFSDQPSAFTLQQVGDWLNKPGYSSSSSKGSVRDYFFECSNGKLELTNDVVGYYRAKKTKAYYESVTGYAGSDELVEEMIANFDGTVDFSKYDNDKNGTTEAINFVYSGSGKTWGQGLWPHSGYYGKNRDNVKIGSYNVSDMGTGLGLYVFCHETGHMLFGWPDLYWFGDYCIMGNRMSDVNPQAINDFFRADQGWIPTKTVVSTDNMECTAWHNGGGYRYANPAVSNEMFYWSAVKNAGRWSNIKGKGILVYHFDKRISGNTSATKRTLFVVEADGNNKLASEQWPNPGTEATDFFGGTRNSFSATTTPASLWGLRIYDINTDKDTMTFKVGTGVVAAGWPVTVPSIATDRAGKQFTQYDLIGRVHLNAFLMEGQMVQRVAPGCYVSRMESRRIVR